MKTRISPILSAAIALVLTTLSLSIPHKTAYAETFVLRLKPGEQATFPFSFWCMDYGKPFPTAVETVGDRAPEGVIAVVRAAVAKGVTVSDPYQTQLAIWRVLEGEFKDFAKAGTVLAQEIYSDSLQVVVPPLPEGELTLAEVIAQGAVTATVEGLTPTLPASPTIQANQAFNGSGALIIRNVSDKAVRFVVPEGLAFAPSGGADAQRLVAELRGRPDLPATGSERPELPVEAIFLFGAGAALFGAGAALFGAGAALSFGRRARHKA
ncbi:MAG: hypothetical protein ACFLMY_14580 [Candidatus Brachytrichaceae bacterium NZ_4S206]